MPAADFIFKMVFAVMATLFILTVGAVLIQYGDKLDYEQFVNASIERHGGLTPEAIQEISDYSNEQYKGRFTMKTSTAKVAHGEKVEYEYEMNILPVFMDFEVLTLSYDGVASSKVR